MQVKQHVQATLQYIVLEDSDSGVRKAAADVISAVAGIASQYEGWPELLPWLNQCTQASNEQPRAMAINLIANLIESGGALVGRLSNVFPPDCLLPFLSVGGAAYRLFEICWVLLINNCKA